MDRRPRRGRPACSNRSSGAIRPGERQDDPKLRSARLRLNRDFTIVVADQTPDDVKAQAGTQPYGFGSEEWIENALVDLGRYAGSIVHDAHNYAFTPAVRGTSTRPESGTASRALSIRFAQIWLSSPAKPRTRGSSGSTSKITLTEFALAFDLTAIFTTTISDDGAFVAGADFHGSFSVWKAVNGEQIFHIHLPHYQLAMAFSPDGTRLALALANEPVQVYSLASQSKMFELPQAFGGAQAIAFSPNGSRIPTADSDTVVRIFDSRNGELIGRYTGFLLEPFVATFTTDGKELLTAGADKLIVTLDASSSVVITESSKLRDPVQSMEVSPDGRFAAHGCST